MIVAVIVSLLVVIGLAVLLWRARASIDELSNRVDALEGELGLADNEITAALATAARTEKERDDAFERVQRARRDASEVAGRLQDEQVAREAAEARAAAAEATAGPDDHDADLEQLWSLALAASARTWRTSVAAGGAEASPLEDADDLLRVAIEIEVDAAREEAGAAIDLVWRLDGEVSTSQAVLALATVQELVASIAKTASAATMTVADADGGVEVSIEAADDDGAPLEVAIAGRDAVSPGRYRVGSA